MSDITILPQITERVIEVNPQETRVTLDIFDLRPKYIIQIGNGGGGGGGNVTITRSDASTISIVTAPNTYSVGDSTVDLLNSLLNNIGSVTVMADSTGTANVPDTNVQLKDSAGNNIGGVNNLPSGISHNITAPDGTAYLIDTASNPISTTNVRSFGSVNITAPDATVTLNGNAFLSPRSNQTVAATLTDEDNVQIPYTQVSNQVKVDMYLYVDPFWEIVRDLTLTGNYNNLIL